MTSACLAGRQYFHIGPQGEVTPCPYIPSAAGSVRWKPLRELWEQGSDFIRLRNDMPGGKCGACDYRISCGGCRARALATSGDLMAEDSKCGYLPIPGTAPEMPARPATQDILWMPEAQRMLERIPGFIRGRIKGSLEKKAQAAGLDTISIDFMHAHRSAGLPFSRPG